MLCCLQIFDLRSPSLSPSRRFETVTAGPIMCSASTAYHSLKDSGLRPEQWAVFPGGGGGVGIQGVQSAVAMGVMDPAAEVVRLTEGGVHVGFVTGEF